MEKKVKKHGYAIGFEIGTEIARLEFLWDSIFPEAKKEAPIVKKHINDIIDSLNVPIRIDESSFPNYCESIINFFKNYNESISVGLFVGIGVKRLFLAQPSRESKEEMEDLALNAFEQIADQYIVNTHSFFLSAKKYVEKNTKMHSILEALYELLK